jgi:hypothetical protein
LYRRDENGEETLSLDPADPEANIEAELVRLSEVREFRARLEADFAARPDDDLRRYVNLQLDGDRYTPYKPREAAEALGLSIETIYLLKERFERRLMRLFSIEFGETKQKRMRKGQL